MNHRMVFAIVGVGLALFVLAFFLFFIPTSNPTVEIDTTMGKITVELFADKAPITVKNFLAYVDDKHYDGTIFHRVISNFMIQGGGYLPGMEQKSKELPQIRNESSNGLKNERGTLAMARTKDPHSASAEFFINVINNDFLDRDKAQDGWGYAVFGKVTAGMDVVDRIRRTETNLKEPFKDMPVEDVIIKSIRRIEK